MKRNCDPVVIPLSTSLLMPQQHETSRNNRKLRVPETTPRACNGAPKQAEQTGGKGRREARSGGGKREREEGGGWRGRIGAREGTPHTEVEREVEGGRVGMERGLATVHPTC